MTDDDNVRQLPNNAVIFDLDVEVKEDPKPPFVANISGRAIQMTDPEDIDWQDLVDIGDNPVMFLRFCVTPEDRDYIFGLSMPGWKLGRLMENYQKHYGIDEKMRKFEREQRRGF